MPLIHLEFSVKRFKIKKIIFITCIRSDHDGEFENHAFENFCNDFGIEYKYSSLRTPPSSY